MRSWLLLAFLLVTACASTQPVVSVVPDAAGVDPLDTSSTTCEKPYALTQDCDPGTGATRNISFDGFNVKVAGSAAGNVILVMDAHAFDISEWDIAVFGVDDPTKPFPPPTFDRAAHSQASNQSYTTVRKVLDREGIVVTRVRPLLDEEQIDGYVLEVRGDGYAVLKPFSKE